MRSAAEGDAPPSDEQQPLTGKLSFPPSALHDEYGWMESPPEYPITERGVDVGLVGGWASDFDMLLSDPIGIKAFTVRISCCDHGGCGQSTGHRLPEQFLMAARLGHMINAGSGGRQTE